MKSKGCPEMTVAEIGVFSRMIHDKAMSDLFMEDVGC